MAEGDKPTSLKDLEEPLRAARRDRAGTAEGGTGRQDRRGVQSGLGTALRIGVDFVAAIAVGVGLGLLLDYWLDTKPWFLILFFLLGAAAGFLNVFRMASGYGMTAGYTPRKDQAQTDDGNDAKEKD